MMRPRDRHLEREVTALAAEAAGIVGYDGALDNFADHRAHPGGVRGDRDLLQEAREELADARNYLVWAIEPIYQAYLDGDADATELVRQRLTALSLIVQAWEAVRA